MRFGPVPAIPIIPNRQKSFVLLVLEEASCQQLASSILCPVLKPSAGTRCGQVLRRQSGHEFSFGASFLLDSGSCRHKFGYRHPEGTTTHVVNIYCIEELN